MPNPGNNLDEALALYIYLCTVGMKDPIREVAAREAAWKIIEASARDTLQRLAEQEESRVR